MATKGGGEMWCPDPACRAAIPSELWSVEEYGLQSWDEESFELFAWLCECPSCRRSISARHAACVVDPREPPPDAWCCPLCGWPALLVAENRGPLGAFVRCLGGCDAITSVSRRSIPALLAQGRASAAEMLARGRAHG